MNTLNQWLEYIAEVHPSEIEMGLGRVRSVFEKMSSAKNAKTQKSSKVVVVSGTNGKGSTVALLEAGLLSMGLTVGSYTSPHIQKYNERVKINAQPVSDEVLINAFEQVERLRSSVPLTYFEFGTLAAFDVLLGSELDVIIFEIGLGGRLDAVNVIDADLAIITSVAMDHTDWLGSSLDGIGLEKAGILRPNGLSILGENLPVSVAQQAQKLNCKTMTVAQDIVRTSEGVMLSAHSGLSNFQGFPNVCLPQNNILIALQALKVLTESLTEVNKGCFSYESLIECFNNLKIEGRFEEVSHHLLDKNHRVFLDVGHNPHAASYLLSVLNQLKTSDMVINAVYSSLEDKDVSSLVKVLAPAIDMWLLAPLNDVRALPLVSLERLVGKFARNMLSFQTMPEALAFSLEKAQSKPKSLTLVFGSFYVIDAAKAYFEGL